MNLGQKSPLPCPVIKLCEWGPWAASYVRHDWSKTTFYVLYQTQEIVFRHISKH